LFVGQFPDARIVWNFRFPFHYSISYCCVVHCCFSLYYVITFILCWPLESRERIRNSQLGIYRSAARRFEWIRFHPRAVIPQYTVGRSDYCRNSSSPSYIMLADI
jgi:hypothetical protein